MKQIKLLSNKKYTIDLSDRLVIGNIPKHLIYDRLCDGRIIGLLVEDIISHEFIGLTRVRSNNSAFDLIHSSENGLCRIQCKSFKTDVNLCPSNMIGKGRVFDKSKFDDYIDNIDMFILIKIDNFPKIDIIMLPIVDILKLANITEKKAKISKDNLLMLFTC